MRRVKGATKFTIIQVIIDKLVHPRYFLSTIFPLPLLWIIQSFVSNPNPRPSLLFVKKKKKQKKSLENQRRGKEKNESIQIGTVQSIKARNQLLNEFIKRGRKMGEVRLTNFRERTSRRLMISLDFLAFIHLEILDAHWIYARCSHLYTSFLIITMNF